MLHPHRRAPLCRRARDWVGALGASALVALGLVGCGSSSGHSRTSSTTSPPSYITEPPTHQQLLVNQGARLIVADGCAACHLEKSAGDSAPSFASFAGNDVTLSDGRRVLVDEAFLRKSLRDPSAYRIKGYRPGPMLAAVRRLHLAEKPQQIVALAAFIEEIGPEPE
jgi:hypothetical protein